MIYNNFDKEYYVMSVDGANNHPLLAWGKTDYDPFLEAEPIDAESLEKPLEIVFGAPYLKEYEMADFLMLSGQFAASEKLKQLFETSAIYGIQFFPVEIKDKKGNIIVGHNAIHIWNQLPAIDKNNYEGSPVDRFGTIVSLEKFSLDANLLESIPLEKRQIFLLTEDSSMVIVHQTIQDTIQTENLTGIRFFRVDEWNDNAMFR
jgi:hypothetical protein